MYFSWERVGSWVSDRVPVLKKEIDGAMSMNGEEVCDAEVSK